MGVFNNNVEKFWWVGVPNNGFCPLLCQKLSKLRYSEVPNRRACSLRFFRFSFHPAYNFLCNKCKFHSAHHLLIYLVNKQTGWHFFPSLLVYSSLLVYQELQSIYMSKKGQNPSIQLNVPQSPLEMVTSFMDDPRDGRR